MGSYLVHYGTKGQKWGIRNYQNEDGTYTEAGKERYFEGADANTIRRQRITADKVNKIQNRFDREKYKDTRDQIRRNEREAIRKNTTHRELAKRGFTGMAAGIGMRAVGSLLKSSAKTTLEAGDYHNGKAAVGLALQVIGTAVSYGSAARWIGRSIVKDSVRLKKKDARATKEYNKKYGY